MKLLKNHFDFLETDFGFEFSQISDPDFYFKARNEYAEFFVSYDKHQVETSLEPINDGANQVIKQGYRPSDIAIGRIVGAFGYKPKLSWDPIITNEQLSIEFDEIAYQLKEFCEPMLNGDFSDWHKIEEFINNH